MVPCPALVAVTLEEKDTKKLIRIGHCNIRRKRHQETYQDWSLWQWHSSVNCLCEITFNYISTTCEPQLNLSTPSDESSLELYPTQEPPLASPEEISAKTIITDLDNCIKAISNIQYKLSKCTLTKLELLETIEYTLYKLKQPKGMTVQLPTTEEPVIKELQFADI